MITQCCVCHKARVGGDWVHVSDQVLAPYDISHGYCPPCANVAMAELHTALQALEHAADQVVRNAHLRKAG